MIYVAMILGSVVLANLSVAWFGPSISIINAFVLIGINITARDRLHEIWHGKHLSIKMMGLIMLGALITWILNADAGRIGIASVIAFSASIAIDGLVYELLFKKTPFVKINCSNIASSVVDSVLFTLVAFGSFLPWIILGQVVAKILGGYVWSLVLCKGWPSWPRRGR